MDKIEAKELLLIHSFVHTEPFPPRMETGFLGSLRPYTGLNQENYDEVMAALKVLASDLQTEKYVDKEVMMALWGICFYARFWGVDEDGMLVRNNLISSEDKNRLREWVNSISFTVDILLSGGEIGAAFNW